MGVSVSVPVSVMGCPFTPLGGPEKISEVVSGFTVNVLEVLTDPMGVEVVVSPGKRCAQGIAVRGLAGRDVAGRGPLSRRVIGGHVSEEFPLRVNVTGSLTMGALVSGLVSAADTGVGVEKLPVTGATVSWDGSRRGRC